MAKLIHGDRVGRLGKTLLGCSVVVFDDARGTFLLTRRTDNGRWCLPGGAFDPGESVTETAVREVKEETGLDIEAVRLVGVYSDPNRLLEYADGNRYHLVSLNFEAKLIGGELTLSDETTEFMWCTLEGLEGLDIMEHHVERLEDTFAGVALPFVR